MNENMPDLYAWIGEDELGSGEIGLKQAFSPAGLIPLVAVSKDKMLQRYLLDQMARQSSKYGKTIRLCRYRMEEVMITLASIPYGQVETK
jgi:hypothetical protein